jgi:acetoin utilization deacetylase AcuC-like enzyme
MNFHRFSLFRKPVGVVFSHEYNLSLPAKDFHNTFDPLKYKKIRDLLVAKNLVKRKKVLIPRMVSYADLELVHSPQYLKRTRNPVLAGEMLKLEQVDPWDSQILEYFRIMTGGTLLATKFALDHRTAAFNLGGGFHHAQPDKAAGFCLLNDVAVSIEKFRKKLKFFRPMIIDLDYHQGDGNTIIFRNDPQVGIFSMHASSWINIEKENNTDIVIPESCDGMEYIDILNRELPKAFGNFNPDMVFFIAGSDPYELDTIGDLSLTRAQMLERNMFVSDLVSGAKVPLVTVAGGGYGPDSWQIYFDFIEQVLLKT